MEKLMSFFHTDKRKTAKFEEEEEDRTETPPPDDRRKWSISRSGRMKQANKKRHNVTVDLYGETYTPVERPTSVEYHVNSPAPKQFETKPDPETKLDDNRSTETEPKSPEEEIESAFEILDKADKGS